VRQTPVPAYLGLGSNQGDSERILERARERLHALPGTRVTAVSRLYRSAPVGGPEQPDYLNQVVAVETTTEPALLLQEVRRIEADLGRERTVRWGPRTLDIDILWYHGPAVSTDDLQIPHPRMGERRFVLEPLAELAPHLVLPDGTTVREALALVSAQTVELHGTDKGRRTAPGGCGSNMDYSTIQAEIRELAREKQAVILVHNYQRPEVQDIADILGDSLWLSQQAAASEARFIVFCGVHFMAETAAILSKDRPVILPDSRAGCPMAHMVDVPGLLALKEEHPDALVVSYVNTTAAVKAISDICCTSANAVEVVKAIEPGRKIIFTPDVNLGSWVSKKTGREVILWPGFCPTHDLIEVADIERAKQEHPQAKVVVHPECRPEVAEIADAVESTSGMIRFCREDDAEEYLIATELGMVYRLSQDVPGKRFYPVSEIAVCPNMKLTTLEKVRDALRNEGPVVTVEPEIAAKALRAVQRMIEVLP
jgi:quinolinate synthase